MASNFIVFFQTLIFHSTVIVQTTTCKLRVKESDNYFGGRPIRNT